MGILTRNERIAAGIYFVWFFLHCGCLFLSQDHKENEQFWPFTQGKSSIFTTYDLSEFIVYISLPLVLWVAYRIINSFDPLAASTEMRRPSHNFFIAFLKEKIKVAELQIALGKCTGQPVKESELEELKKDLEIVSSKGVANWLGRNAVRKKYKAFEQQL